jgi:hypothetical protein
MDTRAGAGYAASWTTEGMSGEKTMTEAEWLVSTDLWKMWELLSDRASERKLKLLACTCCRSLPTYLESEPDRNGLVLTERDVDGLARDEEFERLVNEVWDIRWYRRDGWNAAHRAITETVEGAWDALNVAEASEEEQVRGRDQAYAKLAQVVREIFGNPFRPIIIPPTILAWNDATVVRLAQAAYEERHLPAGTLDSGRLAVLADALEEAGCTDADILDHLRGSGPHVRGCWTVDLCLGKS